MVLGFADEMKKLGENITASYDVRIGAVKDIIKNTHSTLKNFHSEHMRMSEEQRAQLAHFKKNLIDETQKMLDVFAKEHKGMTTVLKQDLNKVHTMLNEFRSNFEKMAAELRKMLSSYYKGEIKQPVHDMLAAFHNEMKKLANEFHQAHNAWMSFSRSRAEKREVIHPASEIASQAGTPAPKKAGRRKRKYSRKK